MAKLKGAAKAAFLRRINKGRVKAGLKKIGSKAKSGLKRGTRGAKSVTKRRKANKPSRRRSNVPKKKGRGKRREGKAVKIAKRAGIGALLGLATWAVSKLVTNNDEISNTASDVAASFQGPEGVLTTVAIRKILPMVTNGANIQNIFNRGGSQQMATRV